jgi:hypothetical protein
MARKLNKMKKIFIYMKFTHSFSPSIGEEKKKQHISQIYKCVLLEKVNKHCPESRSLL